MQSFKRTASCTLNPLAIPTSGTDPNPTFLACSRVKIQHLILSNFAKEVFNSFLDEIFSTAGVEKGTGMSLKADEVLGLASIVAASFLDSLSFSCGLTP